ncbi:MAG: MotA/TolQ/ExbB proton channel family protein [Myxococcota bacterium]|nr:MotA/TolQ/ExbB proton channel family protein [Myxococcota bacterium]
MPDERQAMQPFLSIFTLSCAVVFMTASTASANGFAGAQKEIDSRLTKSLRELAQTRDKIAKQKIPLSSSVSALENEVLGLRQERNRLLKLRDSRTIDLASLRRQVESLEEQEDFVNSRLNEFVRDFEGRLGIAELPRFEELTAAAKLAEKNVNLDAEGKRSAQLAVVQAALQRVRDQLGGQVFAGEALSPDGVLTQGRFVAVGPTMFYASDDGSVIGLVESQLNAADPVVARLPDGNDGIRALARGEAGVLPFDATLGKALKTEKARKTLFQYVDDGGVVGYVIIALGAAALLLTAFKSREILGFPVAAPGEVDGVLEELARGDSAAAARSAAAIEGTAGEILSAGVEHAGEKRGVLEELLFEKILKVRPTLERFLPFLAITAAAAPLLGLLGTVIGMIKTFQLITIFGTGDAKSLSSGISEALVTTALGLIVAIPTLILHGALSRMAKHKLGLLEQVSVAFVNGVSSLRPPSGR